MSAGLLTPLRLPKWGLSMKEGTVVAWLVEEGAPVRAGDDLVEVETDKVNNVVEAPASGTLLRRVAPAGSKLRVGELVGVIGPGETPADAVAELVAGFARHPVAETSTETAPDVRIVDVDGLAIRTASIGSGPGVPAVLIHGFASDSEVWLANQDVLGESRRVVLIDLPGHGGSVKALPREGLAGLAPVVRGALARLDISDYHLVGHSLGGLVATALAQAEGRHVLSLTLIASAGLGPDINGEAIRALRMADSRKGAREAFASLVADATTISREMIERFLSYKRTDGVPSVLDRLAAEAFDADRQLVNIGQALEALGCPVLAIVGADDKIIPAADVARLPARLRREVIAGAGHLVQLEKAAAVNGLLTAFLAAAEQPTAPLRPGGAA